MPYIPLRRDSRCEHPSQGDVFASPANFPISGGRTGMLGEAGPEAIMPLRRGPDGSLGTSAGLWLIVAAFITLRIFVPFNSDASTIGQTVLCMALVGSLYYGRQDLSSTRILLHPVCQFLGRISYSFYLLNVLFLLVAWSFTSPTTLYENHALEIRLVVGVVVSLVTVPIAYLVTEYVERPGVAMGAPLPKPD